MSHIDFIITQSSIDNGRLYFESAHTAFFPADTLGGRGANEHAAGTIGIEVAGETAETDIRISSSSRISPRKSFKTWLRSIGAFDGARGRLHKTADRRYKLEYLG